MFAGSETRRSRSVAFDEREGLSRNGKFLVGGHYENLDAAARLAEFVHARLTFLVLFEVEIHAEIFGVLDRKSVV